MGLSECLYILTPEEYTGMHFIYCSCSATSRAAMVDQQLIPEPLWNSAPKNIWGCTQNCARDWFLPQHKYRMWTTTAWGMWFPGTCAPKPMQKYMQNFQDNSCSTHMDMGSSAAWWLLFMSFWNTTVPLTGRWCHFSAVLWIAALVATNCDMFCL